MDLMQRLGRWLIAAGMVMVTASAWADEARIAVAAEADHAEAPVSAVAARAPHILVFDAGGVLVESQPNPVAASAGGAGPALAAWLGERNVGTLIAGDFGAKLARALDARGIRMVTASGPAAQAVKKASP
jgi:predicted Fe-Mo cluster-binding NifX family protein